MPELNDKPQRPQLRVVRNNISPRVMVRLNLDRPGAAEALGEVAGDWLYQECSEDGKRKLLREHDLLAA